LKEIKFVFVGNCKVGKTRLIKRYLNDTYNAYVPTVHDTYSTRVCAEVNYVHNVSIWDTSGDEDYDRLRPLSYMRSDIACIVFSYDSYSSFVNIGSKWYPEIRHFIPDAAIIIVGVKAQGKPTREIDPSEVRAMAKLKGVACYIECDPDIEVCLNQVISAGLREYANKAAKKKKKSLFSFFTRKKDKTKIEAPLSVKHLHYGVHNSHVGKNIETGFEEMWMLAQAPNHATTLWYIAF